MYCSRAFFSVPERGQIAGNARIKARIGRERERSADGNVKQENRVAAPANAAEIRLLKDDRVLFIRQPVSNVIPKAAEGPGVGILTVVNIDAFGISINN